jgi:hypothetical protein
VRERAQRTLGIGEPDVGEESGRARPGAGAAHAEVLPDRLLDLLADREHRVKGRHRVLEHHPDPAPADVAQGPAAECEEVEPAETSAPGCGRAGREQPDQREHRHRLAAAALARDAEGLALATAWSTPSTTVIQAADR